VQLSPVPSISKWSLPSNNLEIDRLLDFNSCYSKQQRFKDEAFTVDVLVATMHGTHKITLKFIAQY
jgi:hypothetical protein